MGAALEIRTAHESDAEDLARAWTEFGSDCVELDADAFRLPDQEGLVPWFARRLRTDRGLDASWLVAERDARVIGFIQAQIWRPDEESQRQLLREVTETILKIDSLMVLREARRTGVATALMEAAERWGKERGATRAVLVASLASQPAVVFYEERMGYERRTIGLSKLI